MLVHCRRARSAGQQRAWMMSVLAELERIGGERIVSLVKERPAKHNEQELARHGEPVEAPVEAPASAAASTEKQIDVRFHGHNVSFIHQ